MKCTHCLARLGTFLMSIGWGVQWLAITCGHVCQSLFHQGCLQPGQHSNHPQSGTWETQLYLGLCCQRIAGHWNACESPLACQSHALWWLVACWCQAPPGTSVTLAKGLQEQIPQNFTNSRILCISPNQLTKPRWNKASAIDNYMLCKHACNCAICSVYEHANCSIRPGAHSNRPDIKQPQAASRPRSDAHCQLAAV